jgi:hypothetical protein
MRKLIIKAVIGLVIFCGTLAVFLQWQNHKAIEDSISRMKNAITKDFHDPDSARFREIRLYYLNGTINERLTKLRISTLDTETALSLIYYDPELFHLCGEVNAKNGFGAYVGYKKFDVVDGSKPIALLHSDGKSDSPSEYFCLKEETESLIYSESN